MAEDFPPLWNICGNWRLLDRAMIALATNAQMQGTTVPTTGLHWIIHGYCIPAEFLYNISTSLRPTVCCRGKKFNLHMGGWFWCTGLKSSPPRIMMVISQTSSAMITAQRKFPAITGSIRAYKEGESTMFWPLIFDIWDHGPMKSRFFWKSIQAAENGERGPHSKACQFHDKACFKSSWFPASWHDDHFKVKGLFILKFLSC